MNEEHRVADAAYDASVAQAVTALIASTPDLLLPPRDFSNVLREDRFIEHLVGMIRAADTHDYGKLTVQKLSEWRTIGLGHARGILGRHPLIPLTQPVRAALELQSLQEPALAGVIKLYAGTRPTTLRLRGVHRPSRQASKGRQLHLEFMVVTTSGRAVLVNTERFAVNDVTADDLRKVERHAARTDGASKIADPRILRDRVAQAAERFFEDHWGTYRANSLPRTVAQHVDSLIGTAIDAARLVGAESIYRALPIVSGQLVTVTKAGHLPAAPIAPLVGHDIPSIERLIGLGVMPALDLNLPDATRVRSVNELPFTVKLSRREGSPTPLNGSELLQILCDPKRATPVPREALGLPSTLELSINYADGLVDLPSGPQAVRVYYRAGYAIPHNLYLGVLRPADIDAHNRALRAIVADSTQLHARGVGPIANAEVVAARKGAFDPGGERAWPTESLAAIARMAADRELHRRWTGATS